MGRVFKVLFIFVAALVGIAVAAVLVFSLLFDPNDYRDRIAGAVEAETGREFRIEGELSLSIFPWLAVEMGRTELGNAEGFGPEPFATFESAALSVRLLPLLLRQEIEVGRARLAGLDLNLAVDADGRSNWQDLAERQAQEPGEAPGDAPDEAGGPAALDIGSVELTGANLTYADAQAGTTYRLQNLNATTGTIRPGEPVGFEAGFDFAMEPGDTAGTVAVEATLTQGETALALGDLTVTANLTGETPLTVTLGIQAFELDLGTGVVTVRELAVEGQLAGETPVDFAVAAPAISADTEASRLDPGTISFRAFNVEGRADVEPFSFAGELTPVATIEVDAFSPKSLMEALGIEPPPTADPQALTRLVLSARAVVGTESVVLDELSMTLDETDFTGELVAPLDPAGRFELSLAADAINADRYMAPPDAADAAGPAAEEPPLEIPVDLIRSLNAGGTVTIGEVLLGGMTFSDVELGVNSADGSLRLHPLTAAFFDGRYEGDIRIDATGDVATLSANETIRDVSLAPLARTVFEQDNITGLVNGTFRLQGRGNDMADIQRTLSGNLSFSLADGAYEGVDIWYQLRRARALFRQETPPEPVLPARTPFSDVTATGTVTDGVMQNDDFVALLPFMRLTGAGSVNLVSGEIDYELTGNVFDRPEGVEASAGEVGDLAKAVVPLSIGGTLTEPKVGVDVAGLAKERATQAVRDRLLEELDGDEEEAPAEGEEPKDAEDVVKDELKNRLRDLIDR
ncbi:MAG TPA: AsmA family protein [Woeseiaceae bacterium]|nr:AsmA family protein [Woeseiaceae bacterium]